jgi:hypothetical protein
VVTELLGELNPDVQSYSTVADPDVKAVDKEYLKDFDLIIATTQGEVRTWLTQYLKQTLVTLSKIC